MRYGLYRNHEGYPDPTAGAAMSNILLEERRKRCRAAQERKQQVQKVSTTLQKTETVVKEVASHDS